MTQANSHSVCGFVPVAKGQLYYETCGTGDPLVFIHASSLSSLMWNEQWNFFSRYYQVVRYDLRNLGRSTSLPGKYFYHHDLLTLLNSVTQKPAILIGLAGGAAVALDLALEYPQLVRALVLGSPTIGGSPYKVYTQEEKTYLLRLQQAETVKIVDFMLRKWADGPRRTPYDLPVLQREEIMALYTSTFAKAYYPFVFPLVTTPPAFERLAEIHAPTFVLTGAYDMESIHTNAFALVQRIPDAHSYTFSSTGHLCNMEAPVLFNQLVHDFLAG